MVTIQNNRDNNRTQNFTYDALNRIQTAYTSGPNWGEAFGSTTAPGGVPATAGIDAWGNLWQRSPITGKTNYESLNCPPNIKNQLTACSINPDAAGNIMSYGSAAYTYDAENRLISTGGMSYIYDGDGERVEKCTAGATAGTCATNPTGTLYWPGIDGSILNESDLAASSWKRFVFFNGKMVARRDSSTGNVYYFYSDHLHSIGVVADALGQTIKNESDYYPFGGEQVISNSVSDEHYKFTGKERDGESGLDYFGARHNASSLGRFMSPDPVHILKQKLVDPQQWNMYAYVRNNPLRFVDPKGKWIELTGSDEERKKQLQALRGAVGKQAGQYLYDNAVTTTDPNGNKVTNHYVGIREKGPDGKGPSFGSMNAAANKLGGIIQDTHRGAMVAFDTPGPHSMTGSLKQGMSPARTPDGADWAVIHVTSGEIGTQRAELQSNGQPFSPTLADVLSHEFGHVDADWYHGGQGVAGDPVGNGDAVRMENETRQLNAEPLRTGHDVPGDVQLSGAPF